MFNKILKSNEKITKDNASSLLCLSCFGYYEKYSLKESVYVVEETEDEDENEKEEIYALLTSCPICLEKTLGKYEFDFFQCG